MSTVYFTINLAAQLEGEEGRDAEDKASLEFGVDLAKLIKRNSLKPEELIEAAGGDAGFLQHIGKDRCVEFFGLTLADPAGG